MALQEHTVVSASGEYARPVWLLESPSLETGKLCVFLDAEYYLKRMDAPAILRDLQARLTEAVIDIENMEGHLEQIRMRRCFQSTHKGEG